MKQLIDRKNALLFLMTCLMLSSCEKDFLDVVPDNLATIQDAFSMRANAEKYLFTCYSYMPRTGNVEQDPAMLGGDEIWGWEGIPTGSSRPYFDHTYFNVALGLQNKINPIGNGYWDGMYKAIRDCNIFLENIDLVPDMEELEKRQWASEARFLKAYYHFILLKLYGPVPIVDESLPIDASIEEVRVSRNTVDEIFDFIVALLDEATINLPEEIYNPFNDMGRITKPIAMALKAKVLVFRASPLFNGNPDFAELTNQDGTQLFNQAYSEQKWIDAVTACQEAIDICEELGYRLHTFDNSIGRDLSDATLNKLNFRNAICDKWNSELIWGNSQSWAGSIQNYSACHLLFTDRGNTEILGELSAPLKITELFYSENGVPIDEDKSWDYNARFQTQKATDLDYPNIVEGYETAKFHFNRESRYYASIGFDGGVWYGQGKYDESDLYWVEAKFTEANNINPTGNFLKKLIHFENVQSVGKVYSVNRYPWPIIRLADLYLLFAEASNEAYGPNDEAKSYIDRVRERVGLTSVDEAWSAFSTNPGKPDSKEGLREIIQQERMIELAFEGKRFYDIRRWKLAPQLMNEDIESWSRNQESEELFSKPIIIASQQFGLKDYFFPIKDSYIIRNRNLVQNLGW